MVDDVGGEFTRPTLPFDMFVDLFFMTCGEQSKEGMQSIRAIRMLRPFKLIRILKLLRIDSNRVIERLNEASPVAYKLIKILVAMAAAVHMAACACWRANRELNPNLEQYLSKYHIKAEDQDDEYVWSFYFACSVFTTVGFGDITAVNTNERVFIIFLMVISVGFFGTLLSQLQDMLMRLRRDALATDEYLNSVASILHSARVPRHFEEQVKSWVRYTVANERQEKQRRAVLDSLPKYLRDGLALGLDGGLFSKINIFRTIHNATLKGAFTAQLVKYVHHANFLAGTIIADATQEADQVMIITAGTVWVTLPSTAPEQCMGLVLARLRIGDSIGDNSVLGDTRWGGSYGVDLDFTASDNCSVIYLRTADIQSVLSKDRFTSIRDCWQRLASLREIQSPSENSLAVAGRAALQRNRITKPSAFSNGSTAFRTYGRSNLDGISPAVIFFWIFLARKALIHYRTSGEQWRDTSDIIISQGLKTLDRPDPTSLPVRTATIACNSNIGHQQNNSKVPARRVSLIQGLLRRRSAPMISIDSMETLQSVHSTEPAGSAPDSSHTGERGQSVTSTDEPQFSKRGQMATVHRIAAKV